MITQAMLAEFVEITRLLKQRDELRAQILELLNTRAPVEPGELTVSVATVTARRLTRSKLAALLGDARVEELLRRIDPTVTRRLDVRGING